MSGTVRGRLLRRAAVLGMTIAVVALGVATVGLAAQWRAETAPLDVAPVAMSEVEADLEAEMDRARLLADQIYEVSGQVAVLRGALLTANDTVEGDAGSASELQAKLDKAGAKLARLQKQLKSAQRRLEDLNDAAARQAALNRAAAQRTTTVTSGGGGTSRADGGDDEEEEDDD
jgi:chromosome segregation ATPase